MSGFKRERVAELLLSFLAEEIRRIDDPRLLLVSLTSVDISPDLKSARVYWTVFPIQPTPQTEKGLEPSKTAGESSEPENFFPSQQQIDEVDAILTQIAGQLKRRVAAELKLRFTPQLQFRYDLSIAAASRIDYLVRKVGA